MAKVKKVHLALLIVVLAVLIWSVIKPAGYLIWSMEVLPAVVFILIAIFSYNKFRLTTLSYVILAVLAIWMFIGGHYTYSKVPLFSWIKETFDLERNHFDRVGHFLKGFSVIIFREILVRTNAVKKGKWMVMITLSITLSIGALYEIIEWLASKITKGGKASQQFLGTQGDVWDSQWDMLLTLVGSIVALLLFTKWQNRILRKENKNSR